MKSKTFDPKVLIRRFVKTRDIIVLIFHTANVSNIPLKIILMPYSLKCYTSNDSDSYPVLKHMFVITLNNRSIRCVSHTPVFIFTSSKELQNNNIQCLSFTLHIMPIYSIEEGL